MKTMKRLAGILLAVAILLAMALPAFALEEVDADTGSILIKSNGTIDASKKTFAAFKILDLVAYKDEAGNVVTYEYSVPNGMKDYFAARYNLDKNATDFPSKVVANIREEEDIYAFANDVVNHVPTAPYTGGPVEGGYLISGLPLGYYVISDTTVTGDYIKPVSALMLDTATPGVEVEIKAEKPPVEKEIDEDGNIGTTEDRVDINQAAIGDEVTFVVTSKVPDMTGYNKYYFIAKDTMSKGLTYNEDSMTITVGSKVLTKGADYELTTVVNEDGTTELKVVFKNFIQYNSAEFIEKPIVISYTATLNEDAEINKIPNTNEVYLVYSDNPKVECEGENEPTPEDELKKPTGETPKDETKTYTTCIEIVKTDPIGNRLEGAVFTLSGESMNIVRLERDVFTENADGEYWKLTDGSFTLTDPNSTIDGAPVDKTKYESETVKYTKETIVESVQTAGQSKEVTGTVSSDGTLRFEGLGEGTFVIKEIDAPEGYNMLTETIEVTITWNEDTQEFEYTGAVDNNGVARVTIINQAGTELPSTGGTGTTMFYIIGGILVLAAVVLLVSRKRMSQNA